MLKATLAIVGELIALAFYLGGLFAWIYAAGEFLAN